jgi:SulP family sulfate permease
VQSGGKTRLAPIVHSLALAGAILYAATHIAFIPLPALAGLLCVVGVRLIEVGEFKHLLKDQKIEALAFAAAAAGTVSGRLMAGLVVGCLISLVGHYLGRLTNRKTEPVSRITVPRSQAQQERGVRAVLHSERGEARRGHGSEAAPKHHGWLTNISHQAIIPKSAFVHEQATVIGHVVLSEHVHVAAESSIRADEGTPFFIGANTNVQDGVVIHALQEKWVRVGDEDWAVYVGKNVSLAHDALVHGPCYVGDDTFVGFKAVVHDSVVGSHCYIGIGAIVVGVEIPDERFVPHGMIVATQDAADNLPPVADFMREFNEDVVDVNRGLAVAYQTAEQRLRSALRTVQHEREVPQGKSWEASWQRPTHADLNSRF